METLSNKDMNRKIFGMVIPITIENCLQMTAGIIIMAMIGRIDATAVSAIGLSTKITGIVFAFYKGVGMATTIFLARYFGASEKKKMAEMLHQALLSVIISVVILQCLLWFFADHIFKIFDPSPILMETTLIYFKYVVFGLLPWMLMTVVNGALQGMGNTKTPMKLTFIMNIVAIIFAYPLIFGVVVNPMGIRGAAIALTLSEVVAGVVAMVVVLKPGGLLEDYCNRNFFKFNFTKIKELYRIAVPASSEMVLWQCAALIMTRALLTYGETSFAAYQLGLQAESLAYMPSAGFAVVTTSLVGQGLGANNPELAKRYFKGVFRIGIVISAFCTALLFLIPTQLMRLLTPDPAIIQVGIYYLIVMAVSQIPQNCEKMFSGAIRAAGYARAPMFVAIFGLWGLRVPLTLLITYVWKVDISFVWWAICFEVIVRFCMTFTLYRKFDVYANSRSFN